MTEQHGVYRSDEEGAAVRFERRYDATPEEVWAAVTEPESIRRRVGSASASIAFIASM